MTSVDFYILSARTLDERWLFACKLIEKIYTKNHKVAVLVDDTSAISSFGKRLWQFKAESFVPHYTPVDGHESGEPVYITDEQPCQSFDVLINLSLAIPSWFSQYRRVCEVVIQDAPVLEETRSRFQFYRDRGYPLNSHKMP